MLVVIFAIILLVSCSQYAKQQTSSKRSTINVFSILTTIFTVFEAFTAISMIICAVTPSFFSQMIYEIAYEYPNATEVAAMTLSILQIVFVVSALVEIGITVLGVVAAVKGFKALGNDQWTANAANNNGTRPQSAAPMMVCGTCGIANPANSQFCSKCGGRNLFYPQQNMPYTAAPAPGYAQNGQSVPPQQNFTTAPVQNAPQYEWFCTKCNNANLASSSFCSACGNSKPNM